MFTREEQDFVDNNPEFVSLLRSMSDKEVSAFTEIVTYICDLSQEEREAFYQKVDSELKKMERPSRMDFAQMAAREIENGIDDLSLLDADCLEQYYERYIKGDFEALEEVKATIAEKKMENAISPSPLRKLAEALRNKGYEDKFITEYRAEFTRHLEKFTSGDPAFWETVENLHDEWELFQK